jgi:DedD protein
MADNDDVNTLKRRGRRRLVGAIALVLAAVIVLPMVFDSEPKGTPPPVSVRIPSEDEGGFTPKVTPKAPPELEKKSDKPAGKPAVAERPVAEKPVIEKPAAEKPDAEKPAEKKAGKQVAVAEAERKRAEAALAGKGGEQFAVQVGAFADAEKVNEIAGKLKSAKVPYYTEKVPVASGTLTRVRAGPFATRDAAEASLKKLQELGLKGSKIVGVS